MTQTSSVTVVDDAPPPCPYTHQEAWTLLADGRVEEAMGAFACLAAQFPSDGLSNVGYALSNAMAGADGAALAAMRFAVSTEPAALLEVPAAPRLDEAMVALMDRYAARSQVPGETADALFMIAAIRTILQDPSGAHFAVTQAIAQGDRSPSADVLRAMLVDELQAALLR